jgi:hypothetical protein
MPRSLLVIVLVMLSCAPALSAHRRLVALTPEQHVIEVVRPPYSGSFIINRARFTAQTPACFDWAAGERVRLLAGDWNGRCFDAVLYNVSRHRSCAVWCW